MKRILPIILTSLSVFLTYAQKTVSGKVVAHKTGVPIEFALVSIPEQGLWTTTNEKGQFHFNKVVKGKVAISISCLGFVKIDAELDTGKDENNLVYYLNPDNLLLGEVTITAQKKTDELSTSYLIDRNAINNLQIISISDILSLLPGEQTNGAKSLIAEQRIALRSQGASELDNPSLGTAIEVDGVRLSNNSTFQTTSSTGIEGVGSRNIAVGNIESIEVITGVPSVEHGDLNSGLIKINTKQGKSPLQVEVVAKPLIKSYSANKGFDLGNRRGVLNASLEYSRSIGDRSSPYTTYVRNAFGLTYRKSFREEYQPIELTVGVNGNFGGYNSESDPDYFSDTYLKQRDHTLRGNIRMKWLINQSWITGLEFATAANYSDKKHEEQINKSSSSSVASIHALESGYYIATNYDDNPDAPIYLIPAGYWYQLKYDEDKPVSYSAELKANWNKKIGKTNSYLKVGSEFARSGNYGRGEFYADKRYAPTYREFRYDQQPFVDNISFYAEEKLTLLLWQKPLQLQAGIRSDVAFIKGSEYGTVSSISPRFNSKFLLIKERAGILKNFELHAGWGDAVKLPTAKILFPIPSYSEYIAFASPTMADGTTFSAYNTMMRKPTYNPGLQWQRSRKLEIGAQSELSFANISVNVFHDKIYNPYKQTNIYSPFSYKFTSQAALNDCLIPESNRVYGIDQNSGVVTVSDKTGVYASQDLAYTTKEVLKSGDFYTNGSSVVKNGLEWIADFKPVRSLRTSFRFDGNYFYYKGLDETIEQYSPTTTMSDGSNYKYVGFYPGGNQNANGSITKRLSSNLTITTHIPVIRFIISVRLEACFYDYAQNLSEYTNSQRSFVIEHKDDYEGSSSDIYAGDQFVAMYPLYYLSFSDMNTKIPFAEKFLWAKENDKALYNDLSKLVMKSNYNYYFNAAKYSDYFSTNISLTKEIGDKISITFQANNFYNSMQKIKSSQTGYLSTAYGSGKIPSFYYGLACRLKL